MAQAISNKVLVQSNKYCWMICDYSVSGNTLNYTLSFRFEGGCAQLDNAWIKVGGNTVWSNTGRIHNYEGNPSASGHTVSIHSGSTTISGTQTVTFGITKYSGVAMSGSFSATGGAAPSGGYITYNSSTYDSVTATTGVSNWGSGYSYRRVQSIIVMGSSANDFTTIDSSNWIQKGRLVYEAPVSTTSLQQTMRQDNYTDAYNGPLNLKGMRHYMLAYWNSTNVGNTHALDATVRYMPPAPSIITYTKTASGTSEVYTISFVGDTSEKNSTSYERPNLSRTIRYKIGNGSWVYVDNDTVATVGFVTSFQITLPAGATATIEGWMTYHGMQSQVTSISVMNMSTGVALYGSVNNESKLLGPVYASVNGRTKKIVRIYASVGGATKKVYEDE